MRREHALLMSVTLWLVTVIPSQAQSPSKPSVAEPSPVKSSSDKSSPAKPSPTSNVNVSKYVEQLSKLSDSDVQAAAEKLVDKLLDDFRHGALVEQSRNRRAAYQRYRAALKSDLAQCDEDYQQLTKWLLDKKKQIESQATLSQASAELTKHRFELILGRQGDRALAIESRREALQTQIARIDEFINEELTRQVLTSDQLSTGSSSTYREKVPPLPDSFGARRESDSESLESLGSPLPKWFSPTSSSASSKAASPPDGVDPKRAAAAKRLMEALQKKETEQ